MCAQTSLFRGKKREEKKNPGFWFLFIHFCVPTGLKTKKKGFLLLYKNNVIMNETERRSNNIGNEA